MSKSWRSRIKEGFCLDLVANPLTETHQSASRHMNSLRTCSRQDTMRSNSPRFSVLASVVALFTVQLAVSPTPNTIHNRVTPTVPAHQNFIPTWIFEGSDLSSWRRVGYAQWKAANGELSVSGGPGIIVAKNAMQDYAFAADFKCEAACKPGILLRTETHDGNTTGILISLASDDIALYRASLSGDGMVASREPLFVRPKDAPPTPVPPDTGVDIPGSPGVYEARPVSQYNPPRPQPPAPTVKIGEWNHIESYIYMDTIRVRLNGNPVDALVPTTQATKFGPFALLTGDSSAVSFKNVSTRDLLVEPNIVDYTAPDFRRQRLTDLFYTESVTTGDVNHDGIPDVIAGPNYWLGPSYNEAHMLYTVKPYSIMSYPNCLLSFSADFNGDGWDDVIQIGLPGMPAYVFLNPKGESRSWDRYEAIPSGIGNESAELIDVDGDGKQELVYATDGEMAYAKPDPSGAMKPWLVTVISEKGPWGMRTKHGVGAGDINGDGRIDLLSSYGWWEQPPAGTKGLWKFHKEEFADPIEGGANLLVYDVNGDGKADVISSQEAHGWGLAWFEQIRSDDGEIHFKRHPIMGDFADRAEHHDVAFPALHALAIADVNHDGLMDIIAGRRWYGHFDAFNDPDTHGEPVLYWWQLVRKAGGSVDWIPHLIDNHSGGGTNITAVDLNGDGRADVLTATRKGVFIFFSGAGKGSGTTTASDIRRR
jgi:hypothetical protein